MTNLIISRACNQSCSYCFATGAEAGRQPEFMSAASFERCLDFLDRSGIQQARFLGGEPTLHPQFAEFVRRVRERGKMIVVFTNGLMPRAALEALEALPPEQCAVVMNVSAAGKTGVPAPLSARRRAALRRLGQKAQPGCNIYRLDFDLDPVLDLIVETGCRRAVRLGLAQPVLGGKNACLPVRAYPRAGERIAQFAERAAALGVRLELDCGFVRCMFSDAAVARLEELGADLGWRCSPIIDIDTNEDAFHCFPLAEKYSAPTGFLADPRWTAGSLRASFESQAAPYRMAGIYKECAVCQYKHHQICSGGCLASIIPRFSADPIQLSIQFESFV